MDQDSMSTVMRYVTHRYWTGEPHPLELFSGNAVRSVAPGGVLDWADDSLPAICLAEVERAEGKVRPEDAIRHRTNVIRWWLLLHHGGYVVHHDLIPITPFEQLPFPVTAFHGVTRCNSFMGFPPGHRVPAEAIEHIRRAPLSDTATSPVVSGERLLTALAGDEIAMLEYPFDNVGNRTGADPWAVFLRFPKERYRQNVGA
jgi:hypothetical protein